MNAVELRAATENDRTFLATVCRSVAPLYEPLMPGAFEKVAKRFETRPLPENYSVFVVTHTGHNGEALGFMGLTLVTPKIAYLHAMYFSVEKQRRGWGSEALRALTARLTSRGYEELVLLAHERATWARNFYRRHGFAALTTRPEDIREFAGGVLVPFAPPVPTVLVALHLMRAQ